MGKLAKRLRRKQRWEDLSEPARRGISLLAVVQIALFLYALVDLIRRPAEEVRGGRKVLWMPVLFVNFIGPLAYIVVGRKRDDAVPGE